ncbi:hypothetical protein ACFLWA_03710 [Chloroflexota bacterium]
MSDTFALSPCCGTEHYDVLEKTKDGTPISYVCRRCGYVFEANEVQLQHVEYFTHEDEMLAGGAL